MSALSKILSHLKIHVNNHNNPNVNAHTVHNHKCLGYTTENINLNYYPKLNK